MCIIMSLKFNYFIIFLTLLLFAQNTKQETAENREITFFDAARSLFIENDTLKADILVKTSIADLDGQIPKTIPLKIYKCLRELSILRCGKLFVVQSFDNQQQQNKKQQQQQQKQQQRYSHETGNLSQNIFDLLLKNNNNTNDLNTEKYAKLSEKELDKKIVENLQRIFKDYKVKMRLLPGVLLNIVPSKNNKLKFSVKKSKKTITTKSAGRDLKLNSENESADGILPDEDTKKNGGVAGTIVKNRIKKNSYKNAILQLAVPVMVMPAILMGSFLPFVLPVLKMATIMTLMLNNTAFIAALLYAARTHVNAQEEQHISYGHPGYH